MRQIARLLAAIALAAGAEIAATAAPASTAPSDPALRQRFLSEYRSVPGDGRRKVLAGRGEGIEAVTKECPGLPTRVRPACFHGIGHASVGPVAQTPARIHDVCERGPAPAQWLCIQGGVEKLAELDAPAAQRVCAKLRGKNAEVCQEAIRNKLYGTRKIGLDHYFVGR